MLPALPCVALPHLALPSSTTKQKVGIEERRNGERGKHRKEETGGRAKEWQETKQKRRKGEGGREKRRNREREKGGSKREGGRQGGRE